jgi:hypothetical protein
LTRKANAMPAGGGGGGWAKMNEDMAANCAKRQANPKAARGNGAMVDQLANRAKPQAASNLTFVKGNRSTENLDQVSQQILEVAATFRGFCCRNFRDGNHKDAGAR